MKIKFPSLLFYTKIIYFIVLALICFGTVGCPPDGGNGDDDDDDNGIAMITAGEWEGNAGFGEVEFEISPDGTGLESFKVIFSDYPCGGVIQGGSLTFNFIPADDLTNRTIDVVFTLGGLQSTDYIAIEGTFEDTGDYISGNFELDNGQAVCSGSWDAQPI